MTPPPSGHLVPLRQGQRNKRGGGGNSLAPHMGGLHTHIVCWIVEGEAQIFGCDLNSKFSFLLIQ